MTNFMSAVDWHGVLCACGAAPTQAVLPGRVQCPLCPRGRAFVYNDSARWGLRLYCRSCHWAGDLIELVSAKHKIPPAEVPDCLVRKGLLAAEQAPLVAHYCAAQSRLAGLSAFWGNAEDDTEILMQHAGTFGALAAPTPGWLHREGRWVRGFRRGEMKSVATQRTVLHTFLRASATKHWASFVAAPLEDAPGRIVDLWMGNFGCPNMTLNPPGGNFNATRLLGAGPGLFEHSADFVVGTTELTYVLRSQCKAYHDLHRPAPLVGVQLGKTPTAMWAGAGKTVLFLAPRFTPALLREAISCDARIAIRSSQMGYTQDAPTLSKIHKDSVSWRQQLSAHLHQIHADEGLCFLQQTGMTTEAIQDVLQTCTTSVRRKLQASLTQAAAEVQYGGATVTRQGSRLFVNKNMISDALPLLDKIHDSRDPVYVGRLLYGRHTIGFRVRASRIEKNPEQWMRRLLWQRGCGLPFIAKPWRAHIVQLGHMFGKPELVERRPPMGLRHKQGTLELSNWAVTSQGTVESRPARVPALPFGDTAPGTISAAAVAALSDTPELGGLAVCLAHLAATLCSGLSNPLPPHLMLFGPDAAAIGLLAAQAFGQLHFNISAEPVSQRAQKKLTLAYRHRMPCVLRGATYGVSELRALLHNTRMPRFVICPYDNVRGVALAVNHRCAVARVRGGGDATALGFASDMVGAYLTWLGARQFRVSRTHGDILADHYASVLRWWDELGGRVSSLLWTGPDIWAPLFAELLPYKLRGIAVVRAGFKDCLPRNTRFVVETDEATYTLPAALLQTIAQRDTIAVNLAELLAGLSQSCGVIALPDGSWRVPADLWQASIAQTKTKRWVRTA